MAFYILKSGICLAIFYGFYKLVLEKESFHVFKRFYLLFSVVLAFVIPSITFTEYREVIPQEVPLFFPESAITHTVIEAEPINYTPIILWSIYGFGVLLFSFKFLKNLSGIIFRIKRNPKFKNQSFINVLLQDLVIPHTFLSYIFLNKHKFETHQIPKEVLLHEETHAKQKHSLDVLFIEILQILFWFNPFIYFFKHSIKLNHEFLADQAVLRKGTEPLKYQSLLLAFSSNASEPLLANAINYSSIKKRFTVMNTNTSKKAFWLRSLIILPLLALLIYGFSEKQVIEKPFVVQQNITSSGVTEPMMKEYRDFINDFENSNKIIYPKYLRAIAIYDLMTEEQRNSVKKYTENIVSNLSNVKPKTPTEAEFNSWKDSSKFAIWIDGTHVNNSDLNNYKASDIKYFANSFVYDNARSEKFPQPYQNHLYTQKGFETTFTKAEKDHSNLDQIKKELLKGASQEEIEEYNNLIKQFNSKPEKQRIIRVKDKNRIEYIYSLMNAEQKRDNEAFPNFLTVAPPPQPYQQKVTPEEIEEFNQLAKQYNSIPVNSRVVKLKDFERLEFIYNKMTKEQRVNAESFPQLPPPPPPPPVMEPKNPSKELLEAKKTYIEKARVLGQARQNIYYGNNGNSSNLTELEQSMMASHKKYLDLSKEELEKENSNPQLKATPEEIAEYKSIINNMKAYKAEKRLASIEEFRRIGVLVNKMSGIQKSSVEDIPVMPPSPMPPMPRLDNPSKELTKARKKFDEKSSSYSELAQNYMMGKKVDSKQLWALYDESMSLYNSYITIYLEESKSQKK